MVMTRECPTIKITMTELRVILKAMNTSLRTFSILMIMERMMEKWLIMRMDLNTMLMTWLNMITQELTLTVISLTPMMSTNKYMLMMKTLSMNMIQIMKISMSMRTQILMSLMNN